MKANETKLCYKLRALRQALELTQEEVADMIGTSNAFVSLYERDIIDGTDYENDISQTLHKVKERKEKAVGRWYGAHIDAKAALFEIDAWMKFEGHVPANVIHLARDCTRCFSDHIEAAEV